MIEEPIPTRVPIEGSTEGTFFRHINVEFLIHELKDPIAVIETALRMLLEKPDRCGPLTARQEKTLKRALRNSKKARGLLADLLEIGRSDAGYFQCNWFNPLDTVDAVLMEVLETADAALWETLADMGPGSDRAAVLRQRGIHFDCSPRARRANLCQDETKFRQIVGNLIKNGLQHRRQRLDVGLDCRDDQLVVDVIDDGPGVDEEHRELIFERYTRLKECGLLSRTGHGLGLAGARTLARHLGGDVCVKSHHGPGVTFCLTLPLNYPVKR